MTQPQTTKKKNEDMSCGNLILLMIGFIFLSFPLLDLYMNFWFKPLLIFIFRIWDRYLA